MQIIRVPVAIHLKMLLIVNVNQTYYVDNTNIALDNDITRAFRSIYCRGWGPALFKLNTIVKIKCLPLPRELSTGQIPKTLDCLNFFPRKQ